MSNRAKKTARQLYQTDPFTRAPMSSADLIANRALKDAIEYYRTHEMRFAIPIRASKDA
jgi:hypothetical protein